MFYTCICINIFVVIIHTFLVLLKKFVLLVFISMYLNLLILIFNHTRSTFLFPPSHSVITGSKIRVDRCTYNCCVFVYVCIDSLIACEIYSIISALNSWIEKSYLVDTYTTYICLCYYKSLKSVKCLVLSADLKLYQNEVVWDRKMLTFDNFWLF